jgi:hypothetical protein
MSHRQTKRSKKLSKPIRNKAPSQWKFILLLIVITTTIFVIVYSFKTSSTNNKISTEETIKYALKQDTESVSESLNKPSSHVTLNHFGQEQENHLSSLDGNFQQVDSKEKVTIGICDEHDQVLAFWIQSAYEGFTFI